MIWQVRFQANAFRYTFDRSTGEECPCIDHPHFENHPQYYAQDYWMMDTSNPSKHELLYDEPIHEIYYFPEDNLIVRLDPYKAICQVFEIMTCLSEDFIQYDFDEDQKLMRIEERHNFSGAIICYDSDHQKVFDMNLTGEPFGHYPKIKIGDSGPDISEILPESFEEDINPFSWTNLRQSLLELCLIFPNLPSYVILEIWNSLPKRLEIEHSKKINLINNVRNSLNKRNMIKYDEN